MGLFLLTIDMLKLYDSLSCNFMFKFQFSILCPNYAVVMVWLDLGNEKNTIRHKKHLVRVKKGSYFCLKYPVCHQKHSWRMSQHLIKNIQFRHH